MLPDPSTKLLGHSFIYSSLTQVLLVHLLTLLIIAISVYDDL